MGDADKESEMRVYLKWQRGGDAGTLELEGDDALPIVRDKVAAACGVHPALQQLIYKDNMLKDSDNSTVRDYGIDMEEDLRVSSLPEPVVIHLTVGGTKYTTMLKTLRALPESSLLAKMFDGLEHQYDTEGMMKGVAGGMSTVLAPKEPDDGSFVIDRDGPCFAYILNYLRSGGGAIALPQCPEMREQLGHEAEHFGFDELAAACTVSSLANACGVGVTVEIILAQPAEKLPALFAEQHVGVISAGRIEAEIEAENARLAEELGIAQSVDVLRPQLLELGAELSEAGLRTVVAAALELCGVCVLDAAAAAALGLSPRDARLVAALVARGVSEEALKLDHCGEGVQGRGTDTCSGGGAVSWVSATGAEPLDLSNGPVYWKEKIVEVKYAMLGVSGNAQPGNHNDPTTLCWANYSAHVVTAGQVVNGHGGWAAGNVKKGDVCVFKLEAHQLSLRVQRLGAQTFTIPTNGVQNLRVFVCLHKPDGGATNRVRLSRAEPGEEY